jgi:hypothetical protein
MPGTQTTTFAIVLAGGVEEQVCQVSKDGLTARVGATSSASASLADPSQARAGAHGRLVATLTPTHLRCDLVDAHPLNISTLRSPGAPAQIRIETVGLDASIAYVGAWD